jgi:opacity protein-like surface antigen
MKNYIIVLFAVLAIQFTTMAQYKTSVNTGKFYMGFGTSVSSFLGGEFGKVYSIRLNYSPDYYDDYGSYNSYGYNSYSNNDSYLMYSPIQLDVNAGAYVTEKLAVELESSFIWHLRGKPDPELNSGYIGNDYFTEKNDNSTLFAIPLLMNVKFFPGGRVNSPFYIKAGGGFQYVSESTERIREYYTDDGYYYNQYNGSEIIASYSKKTWLPGFKFGAGVSYSVFQDMSAFTEIEYSYFKNTSTKGNTPLALDKARYTGLLALNTKIYFSF